MHITTAICLLLAASSVSARQCSITEAQAAETAVVSLDSWPSIYAAYRHYGHCDDGSIAEGFTDKVVHLLATRWDSLEGAQKLFLRDPQFQAFVLRHLDASALTSELDRVASLARNQCSKSTRLLCKQIAETASKR